MATLLPGRYFSLVRNSPDASTKLTCQVQCAPAVQSSVVGSLVEETLPWDGTAPPPPHNGFDPQLPAEMTPSCHRHLSLISIIVSIISPLSFCTNCKVLSFPAAQTGNFQWMTNTPAFKVSATQTLLTHILHCLLAIKQKLLVRKCWAA